MLQLQPILQPILDFFLNSYGVAQLLEMTSLLHIVPVLALLHAKTMAQTLFEVQCLEDAANFLLAHDYIT